MRTIRQIQVCIGGNVPKTFEDSQKLKYNDSEKWEETKKDFGVINAIKKMSIYRINQEV